MNSDLLAVDIKCAFGNRIMAGFEDDAVYERAVLDWKHSCDRTISDTPGFAINGIKVPEAGNYIVECANFGMKVDACAVLGRYVLDV